MSEQEAKEIFNMAIEKYGEYPQLDMLIEECSELIKAVNKLRRLDYRTMSGNTAYLEPPTDKSNTEYCLAYWNLCSEIADVKIMLAQAEIILSKEAIDISYERKLNRLKERMK